LFESGQQDGDQLRQAMTNLIAAEPLARLDYVSVADPRTLIELARVERKALFSLAVFFDQVRLIDNMMVDLQN
jgi:pantoate--beta-alanine ligase